MNKHIIFAAVMSIVVAGCATNEATDDVRSITDTRVERSTGETYSVEVRFGDDVDEARAQQLLDGLELIPASVGEPEGDGDADADDGRLAPDAIEVHIETLAGAPAVGVAWKAPVMGVPMDSMLLGDYALGPNQKVYDIRYKCTFMRVQAVALFGTGKLCVDRGAQGLAGTTCDYFGFPLDPLETITKITWGDAYWRPWLQAGAGGMIIDPATYWVTCE